MTRINAGHRIPVGNKGRNGQRLASGADPTAILWPKPDAQQPRKVDQAAVARRRKANKLARKQRKR